jgi:type IV pilus biogenesis protein CpaD/CtpE
MNRRRRSHEIRTPVSVFFSLFLGAAIAAAGGVLHAYYKNRQIQITREIDAIDRRIEQDRFDIRITEMRMDQLLNRFVIRKQVAANGSLLRQIPMGVVEEIDSAAVSRHSVASAAP